MPPHHLIPRDPVSHHVHYGPLQRRNAPSSFGFFARQLANHRAPQIRLQFPVAHKDAAPNNLTRLADAFQSPAAQSKIHRRLPLAHRAPITIREMLRWRSATNLKYPNELAVVLLAVSYVVQRSLRIEPQLRPYPIRYQRVQTCAFVHLIKMRQRPPRVKLPSVARENRRTANIIQQTFRQIGRRRQVLEPLLILNPDRIAPKFIGDAKRGDIHLALFQNLIVRKIRLGIRTSHKFHAAFIQPFANSSRFGIRRPLHLGVQCRLTQPLLEHARRMQQLVRNNGVVHPHATFVEHAQNGLVTLQSLRNFARQRFFRGRQLEFRDRMHMAGIMTNLFTIKPALQATQEKLIGEVFAPQRFISNARLSERAIEIEHSHQTRPFAAPIGNGKDGTLMRNQPMQHVMTVLPDRFHYNQRRAPRDVAKNLHAIFLAVNESVALGGIEWMPPLHLASSSANGCDNRRLYRLLSRPALLVGRQTQIAAGD